MIVFTIKNIRMKKKISISKLSKITDISRTYIRELENNRRINVSVSILLKIATALDVNVKDLFYTTLDINALKEEMYKRMDKYGLTAKEVLEVSEIIDLLVTLDLKQQNKNKN